jgi:hypothetical protein
MDVDPPTQAEVPKTVATTGDKKPRFEVKKVGGSSGSSRELGRGGFGLGLDACQQ